jgi:hypothetical protein
VGAPRRARAVLAQDALRVGAWPQAFARQEKEVARGQQPSAQRESE